MAGRPRTMAKRLAAIEELAHELAIALLELRPRQYAARAGNEGGDDLARWWNEACRAMGMASIAVGILLGCVEERAGLDWEASERARQERRGLWPPAESVAEASENAEGGAT